MMKKKLSIVVSCLFFLCVGLSVAEAWDPNGTWVNMDTSSEEGLQRVEISLPSYVHGYGQCKPYSCDWGNAAYTSKLVATNASSDVERDAYLAVWIFPFQWIFLRLMPHPENPDYVIAESWYIYDVAEDPANGSTNGYRIEYLKKE